MVFSSCPPTDPPAGLSLDLKGQQMHRWARGDLPWFPPLMTSKKCLPQNVHWHKKCNKKCILRSFRPPNFKIDLSLRPSSPSFCPPLTARKRSVRGWVGRSILLKLTEITSLYPSSKGKKQARRWMASWLKNPVFQSFL